MNQSALKNFAAWARTYLLDAVRARAATFGVTAKGVAPLDGEGVDFIRFNGFVYPEPIKSQRARLVAEVKARAALATSHQPLATALDAVIDEVAYTWFNRLAALRFMEVNDFLPSGVRVLSSATAGKAEPDVLTQALSVGPSLGVKDDDIHRLLDRHEEPELYRRLLTAQCNALSGPLPFLFERLADYSELLLPDGLLHPGGFIDKLVHDIDEEDWKQIEIVGWLYQFYIKDRKDQVIGSVVKKEDIPAATQLFTPRWIVEYMVQNSLGRLWLEMYPTSPLRGAMKYYVENPDDKDLRREPIKLEDIRCLDDACGSGHILVVMFDLLFEMYRERGYEEREIPSLILKYNLVGIDIDRRAAQLAAFAVAMKARSRDRRFFERGVAPHIIEIRESNDLDPEDALQVQKKSLAAMRTTRVEQDDLFTGAAARQPELFEAPVSKAAWMKPLADLFHLFEDAKNYGSLLTVPEALAGELPALRRVAAEWKNSGDSFVADFGAKVLPLVEQAEVLAAKYHVVVANPPYMGGKGMNAQVKEFAKKNYKDTKSDTFAMFIERGLRHVGTGDYMAMVTMESWMFLSSYEDMRANLIGSATIVGMVHMPYLGKGGTPMGINFGTAATVWQKARKPEFKGHFQCIRYTECDDDMVPLSFPTRNERLARASADDFAKIPGSPVAYWASAHVLEIFQAQPPISSIAIVCEGMNTANNALFLRFWFEVGLGRIGLGLAGREQAAASGKRWFPYLKGGDVRGWYGNNWLVINWAHDGRAVRAEKNDAGATRANIRNPDYFFRPSVNWSYISTDRLSVRATPQGSIFDGKSPSLFSNYGEVVLSLLNSPVASAFLAFIDPTIKFSVGAISRVPVVLASSDAQKRLAVEAIALARADWDNFETSWDFADLPLLRSGIRQATLEATWNAWANYLRANIARMQELETENNRLWIDAYGLQDELKPEVPEEEITLARPDVGKDMAAFVSYAVGCMMGRYALDKPGLILADAGDGIAQWFEKIVGSGQWVVDSDGRGKWVVGSDKQGGGYGGSELSGTDRLAEGDGSGGVGVRRDEAVPEGRTLRADQPDPKGSRFGAVEHRRRAGAEVDGGVSAVLERCQRFARGTGDPDPACPALAVCNSRHRAAGAGSLGRGGATDQRTEAKFVVGDRADHCPLSTIHFLPDKDGVIPVLDEAYFPDDLPERVISFLKTTFGAPALEANLDFLADALVKRKKNETSREALRRYLATQFFKDHCQTYKNRPIYWLFTSGPERAFQALVYLHRYRPDTLARMRTEYLHPLQSRLDGEVTHLEAEAAGSGKSATAAGKKLATVKAKLRELASFDEKLKHYADMRIALDLDDGVKVNYKKFYQKGLEIVAPVQGVTSGKEDDE